MTCLVRPSVPQWTVNPIGGTSVDLRPYGRYDAFV